MRDISSEIDRLFREFHRLFLGLLPVVKSAVMDRDGTLHLTIRCGHCGEQTKVRLRKAAARPGTDTDTDPTAN